jgi:hypothetical protein
MTKKYNSISGTTASEFTIGVGTAQSVQYVLSAVCLGSDTVALDKNDDKISFTGFQFYDMKIVAKNTAGLVLAKQIRGTINNTTVTKIEDTFQEELSADVRLTSNGSVFTMTCLATGTETHYTIHVTLTSVVI